MTGRPCGAWADHVDHVKPRSTWPAWWPSSLTARGSTRRWRRLRAWVLNRDQHRCQLLVDDAGELLPDDRQPQPATPCLGPDDPAWLRAACQRHNLQRGAGLVVDAGRARAPATNNGTNRWEW